MGQTLEELAKQLRDANKKVQLIYAFNGTGKTRLSRALKDLIAPKAEDGKEGELSREKILYYNAFTEDLFYWNNDLQGDGDAKLVIQPNTFTEWILAEQGQEANITRNFQRYANDKLTPTFNQEYTVQTKDELGQDKEIVIKAFSEVTFSVEAGGDEETGNFKISKGEESNFIWSIFFTLLEEVVSVLSIAEVDDRPTEQFNGLQYVFVDDPVSSLDENHLIELAVNLADLIKAAPSQLKFVITTHNPLFYNVLHNELDLKKQGKKEGCYLLERLEDGSFNLNVKYGDANKSFSYHLHLKKVLEEAIAGNAVERYHFTLLRNLYEKTAGFLGYARWSDLLDTVEGSKDAYVRAINTFTHSALSNEQVRDPSPAEKNTVKLLLENLVNNYAYWQQDEQNG
ncbi:AAA family ATPase [Rhodobacteraceae bacterium R_SAG5]|nr:AAA family ATPase [Rhodobacteraceae bacterium R_SAG5]